MGLAAMTSKSSDIYEQLKNNLYQDDAIIGEAAGISMGLVMMGQLACQAPSVQVFKTFSKFLTRFQSSSHIPKVLEMFPRCSESSYKRVCFSGSLDEDALSDMVQYAHETQHEKILRGLSLGKW